MRHLQGRIAYRVLGQDQDRRTMLRFMSPLERQRRPSSARQGARKAFACHPAQHQPTPNPDCHVSYLSRRSPKLPQRRWHTEPLDARQDRGEQLTRHRNFGHLERHVLRMPNHRETRTFRAITNNPFGKFGATRPGSQLGLNNWNASRHKKKAVSAQASSYVTSYFLMSLSRVISVRSSNLA